MTIPEGLPDQFLNWRTSNGRKLPCWSDGNIVNAHNPIHPDTGETLGWMTYEQASNCDYGVAFVITEDDPWFFLDMDKCYDVTSGQWTSEASAIFQSFTGAWGEVSQSGKGLHVIGKCDKSMLADRRNKWDGWLEFYTKKRFIAFGSSGWSRVGGVESDVDWTNHILRVVPQREFLGDLPEGVDPAYTGPGDDDKLIEMMMRSSSAGSAFGDGVTFADLWNADKPKLSVKYPDYDGVAGNFDHSSADMALMSHLAFWTGKDMPRMDRLFRRSGLMREKYDKRDDYRTDTVQKAARLSRKVYDRPTRELLLPKSAEGAANREVFLSVPEMMEHFKGCVYVRNSHRIFVPDGALLRTGQFDATYGGHLFTMMPDGTKPTTEAFKAFTQTACYDFPKAHETCFTPNRPAGEIVNNKVNTYVKPDIIMKQGDITPFLEFMAKLLPDENDREILICYMAAAVQNPGYKFQWAPVLQGAEGNGKTLAANCVAYAVGWKYSYTPRSSQLGNRFNSWVENKIFIVVEEFHMNNRRQLLDELKPLITNRNIEAEGKGVDGEMIDNISNWFFCTNYKDAVIKTKNDRRYSIFFTAQQSYEDIVRDGMGGRYFPELYNWLNGEGYAFVAQYLHNYHIPDDRNPAVHCHRAPKTSSTELALTTSLGMLEQEIMEAASSGMRGFCGGWVSSHELDGLMKTKNIRIIKSKIGSILTEMGYVKWGRAPKPIIRENNLRPSLWYKGDISTVDFDNYMNAQR